MADTAVSILGNAVVGATQVWETIMEATGMWPYYFGALVGLLLLRYILRPMFGHGIGFGSGRSDTARSTKEKKDV